MNIKKAVEMANNVRAGMRPEDKCHPGISTKTYTTPKENISDSLDDIYYKHKDLVHESSELKFELSQIRDQLESNREEYLSIMKNSAAKLLISNKSNEGLEKLNKSLRARCSRLDTRLMWTELVAIITSLVSASTLIHWIFS